MVGRKTLRIAELEEEFHDTAVEIKKIPTRQTLITDYL